MRRVLITRPPEAAEETARLVSERGFEPVLCPLLKIVPHEIRMRGAVQAVLVTSGNALAAIPAVYRSVRLLTVGDATAAQAKAAGFLKIHSAGRDAAALAALTRHMLLPTGGKLLLASGEGQGLELEAALRGLGFSVVRRVAYAARPVRGLSDAAMKLLVEGGIAAVLFFSPATAQAFVKVLGPRPPDLTGVDALAISPRTATMLEPLMWGRIRVADHPNQDELLALLT